MLIQSTVLKKDETMRVEVIFTRKNQTADEKIEQLAIELRNINTQNMLRLLFTEQWVIFAQGALRICTGIRAGSTSDGATSKKAYTRHKRKQPAMRKYLVKIYRKLEN